MQKKLKILTVADHFLPAYKAGGAVRTLANMTAGLGGDFDFYILTGDRDLGDREPFPGVKRDQWIEAQGCRLIYLSPGARTLSSLRKIIGQSGAGLLYLNSFFSSLTVRILLLRRLGLLPRLPAVIAPRGEFSPGAVSLKRGKKHLFISAARIFGLYSGLLWQASSEHEQEDITRHFPRARIFIAPDMPPAQAAAGPARRSKESGSADFVFVSRLARKKNVDYALQLLGGVKGRVRFHLYGPVEDEAYHAECRAAAAKLPENVDCRFCGAVPHEEVAGLLERYHFFLFPTRGENFGHVILEALSAGLPVIVSDQTPWRDLAAAGAGWDLPLQRKEQFVGVLQECIDMPGQRYEALSRAAHEHAAAFSSGGDIAGRNRKLFYRAAAGGEH